MLATDSAAVSQIDLTGIAVEPEALRRIPRSLAIRHDILSLSSDGNQLTIALPDGSDRETIDRVRLATGMHVRALTAPLDAIRARLNDAYAGEVPRSDDAPAVRELEELLQGALAAGASDVHIEPVRSGGRIRQRVDGILQSGKTLPGEVHLQLVSRLKLLAGMDIADRRAPQDGRYAVEIAGRSIDARISSMPTTLGEKVVVRLLDQSAHLLSLEALGMPQRYYGRFRALARAPHGFIVVSGPTGSGKTTTLYAALSERDVAAENVCSVEDPVEVTIPGVAQVQVNPRAGVSFASAVRAFLRQDPNVIMVGEMRDAETAAVAAGASLSGQLVMATLHSNDAPTALDRLIELGVARHTIASGLTLILAQRLLRVLCVQCRSAYPVDAAVARSFAVPAGTRAFRATGCPRCQGSGYTGRKAIFECLFVDAGIRDMIARGEASVVIAEAARRNGYEPLIADGLRCVLSGESTFEELRRVLVVDAE